LMTWRHADPSCHDPWTNTKVDKRISPWRPWPGRQCRRRECS